MKKIAVLILLLITVGCQSNGEPLEVAVVDQKLDVMAFELYQEQLYIGTAKGLYVMDKQERIHEIELIKDLSIIRDLQVGPENELIIGGMNGLIVLEETGQQHYFGEEWLPDPRVNVIKVKSDGKLVIGTWDGVIIVSDDMQASQHSASAQLLNPMVYAYEELSDGSEVFGSYNVRGGGVTLIEKGKSTIYGEESEIGSVNIMATVQRDDVFFVGGGIYETGGLSRFELSEHGWVLTDAYDISDGLPGAKVRSLKLIDDILFIGSEYDGVALWTMNEDLHQQEVLKVLTKENGLPNQEVKCTIQFNDFVYFGTKAGIGRLISEN